MNIPAHLPPMPARTDYENDFQYYDALRTWEEVAATLKQRTTVVVPPAMPKRTDYENDFQYYDALRIWKEVSV